MWKRLQGHGREKERQAQIGNPVLLETTYDEDQLRRNPNVTDLQNSNYHYHASAPPQPQQTLDTLPITDNRVSEVPSATSIYSRPSHDLTYHYANPTAPSPSAYEDVSPPSSPEPDQHLSSSSSQPRRYRSMRDVSPMDENRKRAEGSSIPVLRRAPPGLQTGDLQSGPKQKFWGGKIAPNSKVKWDDYSGEPTSSNAGKMASVTPGSYAKSAVSTDRPPMGYHASITGPGKRNVSLPERMGRLSVRPVPGPSAPARQPEPWSRATGRSEIAPPLRDEPAKKPLQLPRRLVSPTIERSGRDGPNAVVSDTGAVAEHAHDLDTHNDPIKPIVPLKVGRKSPPRSGFSSPTSPTNLGLGIHTTSYPSPITPTTQSHNQPRTPTAAVPGSREDNLNPTQRSATPPYNAVKSNISAETPEKDREPTTSRFSWTTYNSATTYQHSPPPSPPPPLPSLTSTPVPKPQVTTESVSAAPSIINRRPVPNSDPPSRKPVPSVIETPGTAKIHTPPPPMSSPDPPSPSAISTFSTATTGTFKALPQPPTSLSASDHISLLESQMEDLRIRRSNVYRLLNDLNNAAPPNPLITDFKRARLVEQRKRAFEDELSDIKREEHDVGLKLHRAWKKREKEDPNTGSALWVRRVTS